MGSRMDRYKDADSIPSRSSKNKALYTQVYNAYDEFENLVVPSNAKEITISDLRKEIISKEEPQEIDNHPEIIHETHDTPIDEDLEEYDINELINKAVSKNEDNDTNEDEPLANGSYLKKLKLDNRKTNIEQVKEMWENTTEEDDYEDESLLKTANLSLEILSDLKSDNGDGEVSEPVEEVDNSFYSTDYKFSKDDFEEEDSEETDEEEEDDNEEEEETEEIEKVEESTESTEEDSEEEDEDEEEEDDEEEEESTGKFFLKILLLIFGILLVIGLVIYFIMYFDRV